MKAIAAAIMRGRMQASLISVAAIASSFFAWFGVATVALVILRVGQSAAPVFGAAVIAASVWAAMGHLGPLLSLLVAAAAAMVLRSSGSWSWVLLIVPASLVFLVQLVAQWAPAVFELMSAQFAAQLDELNSKLPSGNAPVATAMPSIEQLTSVFAITQGASVLFCLMLARWWQSLLYNPGGWQQEFHRLRLQTWHALVLLLAFFALLNISRYPLMALLMLLPFVVAGLSVVHAALARWVAPNQRLPLLVLTYVVIWVPPVMYVLVLVALMDSAIDLRAKWSAPKD